MLSNSLGFSTEPEWEALRPDIDRLWANRRSGEIEGVGGVSIAYACVEPAQRRDRALVISPGRTEYLHKYDELAFDLYRQGFAVYVLDHRGQGLSGRWLSDPQKGDVERFDHYVHDFERFLQAVVLPREAHAPVVIGHSMGGAIAARHLQMFPGVVAGAALFSPMFEINTGVPRALVRPILRCLEALRKTLGRETGYIPGGHAYKVADFRSGSGFNSLTSSERRFRQFNRYYEFHPELQLGAPTCRWLLQAFTAMEALQVDVDKIEVPVTVLMSGDDRIVRPAGQRSFVARLAACSEQRADLICIEGAQHELLMEADLYRLPALRHLLAFIESVDAVV